ncbi:Phenylacetic acid catabolic protein [Halopenitus persicus]|uniref:Ring-1,2-phenylacetyl-CoA epoxidase subunit PaaA n=1 Tax=Halopenitus persicus TaxID=1048396 RepID=A0A1H3EW40_9EURY|nr:Phenylacetic acid catabolic protein [Halopenitus persicus]QHS17723.1 phenylacetate-CoA oxygenase subunit PaaI [haloarchaeon 3A1-DGR]SDX82956.1 ring-1,2-phenylacetyl-CoA epoxidase subunit PaaA [Halopenitus persicus]
MPTEAKLKEQVQNGKMIESREEMTEGYEKALKQILTVSGDTELMSAPAYYEQSLNAPSMDARASCISVIQDELGHGHIAYRLLEDLGEDRHDLIYEREPHEFRNTYGFDQHIDNFAELVSAHGMFDRAGIVLLSDVHENTSYAPWKRALTKVNKEEQFHLRHGETWMRRLANKSDKTRAKLQDAIDWMFPMAIEWFGLPDDKKKHDEQLEYRIKGKTNDELRQDWLERAMPLMNELELDVPAHYDEAADEYVLDYEFPVAFDEENKEWRFDEPISWDDVIDRWRGRGPANEKYVDLIQSKTVEVQV